MRNYLLLCLALLFGVSVSHAAIRIGDQVDQGSVQDGDIILLQTMADTNNGNFFNGTTTTPKLTPANQFQLVNAQKEVNGNATYYLKNVLAGTYVQLASAPITGTTLGDLSTAANFQIITYAGNSNNVPGTNTPGFTEMAVMFKYITSGGTALYLNSNGAGAACRLWNGTGNWSTWNIYKSVQATGPKVELEELLDSVKTRTYAVGTLPGYVPTAEDSTSFAVALKNAQDIFDLASSTDNDYTSAKTSLLAALVKADAAMIPLKDGWYRIYSAFTAFKTSQNVDKAMFVYNNGIADYLAWYSYDADAPSMLWKVMKKEDGNYSIYNLSSKTYINAGTGTSQSINMLAEPQYEQVITPFYTNGEWEIKSANLNLEFHCGGHSSGAGVGGYCVLWNAGAGTASSWRFIPVSDDEVARLEAIAKQRELNSTLKNLIAKGDRQLEIASPYVIVGNKEESKLVFDASFWSSNADQNSLGGTVDGAGLAGLIDGNTDTYWHSVYAAVPDTIAPTVPHYLQANIDPTQKFIFEFTRRMSTNNNRPTDILISASKDGKTWVNIKEITSGLPTSETVNSYTSAGIDMGDKYSYVRFTFKATNSGGAYKGQVFVSFSEFQLYPAELAENAQIKTMTSAQALIDALAKAKTVENATQADIDALQAVVNAFGLELADPADLKAEIALAQSAYDVSTEGDIPGTWTAEARNALKAAIDAANTTLTSYETKTDLSNALAILKTAEKTFDGLMMKVPLTDWYYITSTGTSTVRAGKAMYTTGGKFADHVLFGTLNDKTQNDPHYMWRLVNLGDTAYAIQNKGTGYYIGKTQGNGAAMQMADSVQPYLLKAIGQGSFAIYQKGHSSLHAQEAGTLVVYWTTFDFGSGSSWTFKSVSELQGNDYTAISILDYLQNNKLSFVCEPYNTTFAATGMKLYAICGAVRDADGHATSIKLSKMETVEAGVPFIRIIGDQSQYTTTPVTADTLEFSSETGNDCIPAPKNANGLIGTYTGIALHQAGLGYSSGNGISSTSADAVVNVGAYSAYIDESKIVDDPNATVALTIPVNGILNGICCPVTWNDSSLTDVYSITGVRIRNNVMSSVATKGLPKGIYIVGKRKVTIK